MIIDTHAHLGYDEVFDHDFTARDLLDSQRTNGIDVTLVQPPTDHELPAVVAHHDAIAALAAGQAGQVGRFYGIANPNPHLGGHTYRDELRRCIRELGFVGIKVHPLGHAVNPLGRHGLRAFELADELGVPIMVHTGAGLPWAAPALLEGPARRHASLKIVVAHAGGMMSAEAGELARRCENVYLECSWTHGHNVAGWIAELGANRVMFGSDHAENAAVEMAKFRSLKLSDEDLAWVLGRSAGEVFGIGIAAGGGRQ